MKKPPKPQKSAEKRQQEVETMMEKFLELGFPLEEPGVQEFVKVTRDYSENGIGSSGTIRFDAFSRILRYILSVQPHVESRIALEFTGKTTVLKDPVVL